MYGSVSYGSVSFGGLPASQGAFFTPSEALIIGQYRRTREYTGSASFFAVETRMITESDEPLRLVRIYTHHDSGETPQLQVTTSGDAFYTQSIVGAARFIVVELETLANLDPIEITITGQEYFQ